MTNLRKSPTILDAHLSRTLRVPVANGLVAIEAPSVMAELIFLSSFSKILDFVTRKDYKFTRRLEADNHFETGRFNQVKPSNTDTPNTAKDQFSRSISLATSLHNIHYPFTFKGLCTTYRKGIVAYSFLVCVSFSYQLNVFSSEVSASNSLQTRPNYSSQTNLSTNKPPKVGTQAYFDRLVQAIYHAEGGKKTRHPYGVLKKFKKTSPKQACYNTVKNVHKKWVKASKPEPYLDFLARIYCPVGAKNDPTGLNRHWKKNVQRLLK